MEKKLKKKDGTNGLGVGGALVRASAFRFGLGVSGATIVSGSCARPSHLWMSCLLTSSLSLGISSLFDRDTQCM